MAVKKPKNNTAQKKELRDVEPIRVTARQRASEALYRYLGEYKRIINLFLYLVGLAHRVDATSEFLRRVLAAVDGNENKPFPTLEQVTDEIKFGETNNTKFVRENSELLSRFLVCNSVENFLCYLSDVLKAAIKSKPELLFSSEQIRVDEVLRHGSMEQLVSHLVDKKVLDLSYLGIKDMAKYFSDRLGMSITAVDEEKELLSLFIEIRNIHVHNRGIINGIFLSRLNGISQDMLGKKYHVDFDEFAKLNNNMFTLAVRMDDGISTKFSLPRQEFSDWKAKEGKKEKA